MNKRLAVTASALALGLSVGDAHAQLQMQGSDTMREITQDLIAACGVGAAITYVGGGSGTAGNAMIAGTQQVGPMSRFMNATECNGVGGATPNSGQGIAIGLDGVGVWSDTTEGSTCSGLRYSGTMAVQDLNDKAVLGYGNGVAGPDDGTGVAVPATYTFTSWADVLRIIYTGQHDHIADATAPCTPSQPSSSPIASKRCNSDIRRTLVENWANMFDNGSVGGAGGCADGHCTSLKHAFRRDDFSGTTDAFMSLIGAPSVNLTKTSAGVLTPTQRAFCNGFEAEDLDPIRRTCTQSSNASNDPESVCAPIPFKNRNTPFGADGSPTGAAGSTAPTAPGASDQSDLGLVLPISPANKAPDTTKYDNTFCTTSPIGGSFKYAPMPSALAANAQLCPDGTKRVGGQCRWPVYPSSAGANAGHFNCKARRTNRPGSITWGNFDARYYNVVPRDPVSGALALDDPYAQAASGSQGLVDPRWAGAGHYRIHMTAAQPAQVGTYTGTHPTCLEPDATRQIGCLVQSDPCSIGYSGLEASDTNSNAAETAIAGTNRALALRTITAGTSTVVPTTTTIQNLVDSANYCARYPIARILWLSAAKGFGGFPGAMANITNGQSENTFSQCYTTRSTVDPILGAHGFITLPAGYPEASRVRGCPP